MVINSLRHYGQCNFEIYRIYSAYFIRFRVSLWFEFPLRGGGVQRRHGGLREGPELPGGAARPRGVRPLRAAAADIADGCRCITCCVAVVCLRVTAMSLRPWIQIWCEAKRANIPCP